MKSNKFQENSALLRHVIRRLVCVSMLCIIAFCMTTYAWYVDSTSSQNTTLTAAHFNATATVTVGGTSTEVTPDANGRYALTAGTTYCVTLVSQPDTTASTFYAKIGLPSKTYVTEPFTKDPELNTVTFTITTNADVQLTVNFTWGTTSNPNVIANGANVTYTQE